MRILILLSAVALGTATDLFSPNSEYCKKVNGYQPFSVSSLSGKSKFYNTHVSPHHDLVLPSGSFNVNPPAFSQGLTAADSSVTGTGFASSSGSYASGQQQSAQFLSTGAETGSSNGFFAHDVPTSIVYHAVLPTSSPTSYVHSTSLPSSISLNSAPVQGQDSSYKSGSKTVEIISDEVPTVSTQNSFSSNFASKKSDTILASRFLPIDQNENYISKPNSTSNYNTVVSTDSTTTYKPLVNIPSSPTSPSFPILTSPTPTTSSTPYTVKVTTPVSTTAFPKSIYNTVPPSSYLSTTFKTYSTPFLNNYNSIYSTPKPLNAYSNVFSTAVPVTTPVSTTVAPTYFTPTTFKSYSTPFYNKFDSIYSTSGPLNTYSRVFSTPAPVASSTIKSSSVSNSVSQALNNFYKPTQYVPSVIKNVPNTYSSYVTTQSPPIVTSFKPLTTKHFSNVFSKPYSSDKHSSSYFAISSTPATFNTSPSFPIFTSSTPTASPIPYSVSVTTPSPTTAFPQVNFKTVSTSPYSSTTFKPYSSSSSVPYSYNPIYSTPKPLNSYSKVFSTPTSVFSNVTSFGPVTSKYISNIYSKPYSTNSKSSLYSNVFSSPNTPSSSSFPILASPTPYSVTVSTPASATAFPKDNFKTVTPTPYTSTTFKPFSTTTSVPYSYNSFHSTPKILSSYSSTPAPAVSNSFKISSAPNAVLQTLNTGKSSVDLTSRFDPVHTPFSHASVSSTPRPIETYSSFYPKSSTIHGSSFSINSEPVITETSYSAKPPVGFPFQNINSGVYNVPVSGQHSYYSGNLSPTFKVSENTLYSPPVPFSFSSLSSKSQSYPVPAQLSYPSVYSSTLNKNFGLSSIHDVHSAAPFAYTVQQAPLTKEYHTVQEPVVKTWKSINSWNVAPVSHFETHFN